MTISITPYPMPPATELGEPADLGWHPDPDRAALLVHDMQRYFVRFFSGEPREDLVANIVRLREAADRTGVPVFYTAQPGSMSEGDRGLLRDLWGEGMAADPADRAVIDELAPTVADTVLTKWRYSAFFGTDLLARLRDAGRDQLIISGVYAHVGCLTTALEAFSHDIETFFVPDAVADFELDRHAMAVEHAARTCAAVPGTTDVVAALDTARGTAEVPS